MKSTTSLYIVVFSLLVPLLTIAQDVAPRDVTLKVIDRRGRPVPGIVVRAQTQESAGFTDKDGLHIFNNFEEGDSVVMILPKFGETSFPADGMDSVVVQLRSRTRYERSAYLDNKELDIGYMVIRERSRTNSATNIDVEPLTQKANVKSLAELLQGRVPGLVVSRGSNGDVTASIRGVSSVYSSTEPLVVVNGSPVGTVSDADRMLNVNDIKNISVLKEGSIYGSRGANGVIIISTK